MKKILLTESEKAKILSEREKLIFENFAKTFNSIKRIDEDEVHESLLAVGGALLAGGVAKYAYDKFKTHQLDKRYQKTGEKEEVSSSDGSSSVVLQGYTDKKTGDHYWGVDFQDRTKGDREYWTTDTLLFNDEKANTIKNYIIGGGSGARPSGIEGDPSYHTDYFGPHQANVKIPRGTDDVVYRESVGDVKEDFKSKLKGAAAGAAALAGGLNANAQQAPQAHQKITPGMQIQPPQAANTKAVDGKTADPFNTQKSGGDEESKYAQNHTKPIVDMARGQDGKTGKDAIFLYHVPKNQVTNRTIDQDRTTVYLNNFDKQVKGTPEWRDYVARCKALGLQIGAFAPIDTDYEGRDQSAAITNLKENEIGGGGEIAQKAFSALNNSPEIDNLIDNIISKLTPEQISNIQQQQGGVAEGAGGSDFNEYMNIVNQISETKAIHENDDDDDDYETRRKKNWDEYLKLPDGKKRYPMGPGYNQDIVPALQQSIGKKLSAFGSVNFYSMGMLPTLTMMAVDSLGGTDMINTISKAVGGGEVAAGLSVLGTYIAAYVAWTVGKRLQGYRGSLNHHAI